MSRGYNHVALLGGFVRDPDVKYTVDGKPIARFTLACGYPRRQPDGTYKDEADYPQCVAFGHSANAIAKYCRKGSQVFVEGKIKTGSYEARDGSGRRYTTDVIVNEIRFVGGKKDGENAGHAQSQPQSHAQSQNDRAGDAQWNFNDAADFPPDFFDDGDRDADGPEADIPF
jgi:single-strand DNA-binding protein